MSKSKEELNILKGKYEDVVNEIRELTPEELEQVTGGRRIVEVQRNPSEFFYSVAVDGSTISNMRTKMTYTSE